MEHQTIHVWSLQTYYVYSRDLWATTDLTLFLHGRWSSHASFFSLLQFMDQKWLPYLALDLPGFGRTQFPPENRGLDDYVDFVHSFLQNLWLVPTQVVGHSFGARIISLLVYQQLIQPQHIVFIGGAGIQDNSHNSAKLRILKLGKKLLHHLWQEKLTHYLQKKLRSPDYQQAWALEHIFLNTISQDLQYTYPHIKQPTLLIRGSEDTQTPIEQANQMLNLLPYAQLQVIPGWTHFVHEEYPMQVSRLLFPDLF